MTWSPALPLRAGSFLRIPRYHCVRFSLAIAVSFVFSSCAVTDFVGAYFNTYYNAQRLFGEAQTEAFTQIDARPGGRNYLVPFQISPGTKTKLTSVIEKCSKLLQYHPESKLVDDALLMIGKAYYYQDEDQKAERKFRELIDGYPEGGLRLETELLLCYVQYRMNAREDARATALRVIAEAEKENEPALLARASLVLGQMAVEEKDYAAARGFFLRAAENGDTAEQRSSSHLLVADMCSRLEQYREGEEAYMKAERESDTYGGEYRGRIGALRMRAKQGDYEGALHGLEALRARSTNREFFGEIDLEIGHVYRDMGDLSAAITQYTYVDTLYARTEVSANAYFAQGLLYELKLFQYDSAQSAYAKARSAFPRAEITQSAGTKSDYLLRYFQYRNEIHRYDSMRTSILSPRPAGGDRQLADSANITTTPPPDSLRRALPPAPAIPLDTIEAKLAMNKNELAGLFYATIGLPDSAKVWYWLVIEDHPKSIYVPRALFTLAQIYGRDTTGARINTDSLYRAIIEKFPDTEYADESRRLLGLPAVKKSVDPAEGAYSRAEQLMLDGNNEAAIDTFRNVAHSFPTSPFASQALYAAGWLYEHRLLTADSAIAHYERLLKLYPLTPYASRVQAKIAEVRIQKTPPPTLDSTNAARAGKNQIDPDDEDGLRQRPGAKKLLPPGLPPKPDPVTEPKKPETKEGPVLE